MGESYISEVFIHYPSSGENVESHASQLRKRTRINKASLVPKSVFLNLPSMVAVRRFSLLHPPYSEYQNLGNVGTRKVR
jgi:hypothetical protein